MHTISSDIVHSIADEVGQRLTRRLIRRLQKMAPSFRADDGAGNLWNEICAQIQQGSDWTSAYQDEMERQLEPLISSLPEMERAALWLCVGEGYFFDERNGAASWNQFLSSVNTGELVQHVVHEYVKGQTWRYENATIKKLIDG